MTEGVGDALRMIHRALRPGGTLLDIHPEPVALRVEALTGGRVLHIGDLGERGVIPKLHAARAAVDALVNAGYFARERQVVFAFRYHADSVDAWQTWMATTDSGTPVDETFLARARALLPPGMGELCMCERAHAARLKRVDPGALPHLF